ncbi:hypothetical protein [Vreelandella titanicae]|uniref:hypothetical protein n=1 Tax=Vreelandella titanicae TaxID=664683 RepID=UPI003820ACDC
MQLALDDSEEFTAPDDWSEATKTQATLELARCARCGKRPSSLSPITEGWVWDTLEPNNPWMWCPDCD